MLIVLIALGMIAVFSSLGEDVRTRFDDTADLLGQVAREPGELSSSVADGVSVDAPILLESGGLFQEEEGTELEIDLHPSTDENDLVVVFVLHRSTLAIPNGWQREIVQKTEAESGSYDQWLSVLTRRFQSGEDLGLRLVQATDGRLNAVALTIRGDNLSVIGSASKSGDTIEKIAPAATVSTDHTLVLSASSEVYVDDNLFPDYAIVEPTDTWVLLTPDYVYNNRLLVAAAWGRTAGETLPFATFETRPNAPTAFWASATIQIR